MPFNGTEEFVFTMDNDVDIVAENEEHVHGVVTFKSIKINLKTNSASTVDRQNCDVKVITSIELRSQYERNYSWFCFNAYGYAVQIFSVKKDFGFKSNLKSFLCTLEL